MQTNCNVVKERFEVKIIIRVYPGINVIMINKYTAFIKSFMNDKDRESEHKGNI